MLSTRNTLLAMFGIHSSGLKAAMVTIPVAIAGSLRYLRSS